MFADEQRYIMNLLSIACSVRKGSRMTQKQLSRVLTHLAQHDVLFTDPKHVLMLGTAALMAGEMPIWMGPGRKFIEASWKNSAVGPKLSGALSDLHWGGWRLIELPFTLKYTLQSINIDPLPTLSLLATLSRSQRLDDVDEGWLARVAESVDVRLVAWNMSETDLQELASIVALSSILPSIGPGLVRIAEDTLDYVDPHATEELHNSDPLDAKVFGECAKALVQIPDHLWSQSVDVSSWISLAVKKWPKSQNVLNGLVALSQLHKSEYCVPLANVYVYLRESLLSHMHLLRHDALRLLASASIEQTPSNEVLKRCIQGEENSLDIQGVRERVLRITGAPQVVKQGDEIGVDICARWLIAQLKVNLRPLWLPTAKAIAVLAERFGEQVWQLLFAELEMVVQGFATQKTKMLDPTHDIESTIEAERSWRDPNAAKLRSAVEIWLKDSPLPSDCIQIRSETLDVANYENQLLQTLAEVKSLTQRHNVGVVRLFLSFCSPDRSSKPSRAKLSNWITLFSKLDNPKSFSQTSTLQTLYRSLLSYPDRNLQTLALTCLMNYKSPHLIPYESHLRAFLDNTKWKDELTSFDIATINEEDRVEAVDVIIRLFFGLMTERHGRTKGVDRRASLLSALGGCHEEELSLLVNLMLEPFSMSSLSSSAPDSLTSTNKQQAGFMNLLGDVLKRMGARIVPHWHSLLLLTIKLVAMAQATLQSVPDVVEHLETQGIEQEADVVMDDAVSLTNSLDARSVRTVRQLGVKRFTDFFRCDASFDFQGYLPSAFATFISPRLAILERENTQSPSAIMELFHTWSMHRKFVSFLVNYDDRVLPKIYACLQAVNVKPVVISRIFDIIEHILALSLDDNEVADLVLKPHISPLLDALAIELPTAGGSRSDLLHRQVAILSQIAPFASNASQARRLLLRFSPLLKRPSKIITEKIKVNLLKIAQAIIPMITEFQDQSSDIYVHTYELFAKLFQTLRTKPARLALLDALGQLKTVNSTLSRIHHLLVSLNAYSIKRMDEPDFDRRLQAFTELNEVLYIQLSPREWLPIVFNMLQFIQDPEELVVRTNAAFSLKRFIDVLSMQQESPDIESLFMRTLFPALKNGLLSKVELIRNEIIGVLAHAISKCDSISALSELRPLLANGDNEANFFNNIYHIQVHRRTRALRRLVECMENSHVRSTSIAEIFLPLISHFIINAPNTDHILVDVAVVTTGSLARRLNWGAYNSLVRQYMSLIKARTPAERACVRALVAILENFHFPMDDIAVEDVPRENTQIEADELDSSEHAEIVQSTETNSTAAYISTRKVSDAVNTRLMPSLLQHLEKRDDNEDVLRIPVSVGIAQVACHLPKAAKETQISRLLTILCQVFRSKSQDTRALARESLCKIAIIIGPSYIAQIMTELRAALLRGPHLHILATVAHALLVHVTSHDTSSLFKDLDACAADVAHISAEVIFGQSGHDVRSEGFTTTILEVRGSSAKGLDTFAILAKHITPSRISAILSPLKGVMHETGASRTMQLVDDVLRRISGGLNANTHISPAEYLLLCHTLIQQNAYFLKETPRARSGKGGMKSDFAVQVKRHHGKDEDHYAHNSFRFVVLGLDLFNIAFRRGRFDLQDSQIISRLESMVPVVGNALYSQDVPVVIQGLKATALVIKCPLKSVEESLPVFVRQTLEIVRQAGNTESEAVQAAFRTLAVIIRDCTASQVKEKDLVYLLELLTPDLEEPNRQAAVFALLRAIVSRKFVVVEIYDIMDKVAEIMVTNQAGQVQEHCRSILLQFLLDYPQGKGRLQNQMTFLAQNLSYVFESGRKSVMELLNAIFAKFDAGLLREYADLFFVALVMVIANDDSSKCREMAAELIKLLFAHLDTTQRTTIVSHLHSWSSEKAQLQLSRVSAQVYGLVVDTMQQDAVPYISGILEDMNSVIQRSATELQALELQTNDQSNVDFDVEWRLPYHALNVLNKVLQIQPDFTKDGLSIDWSAIESHLLFPHAWVRNVASRLIGLLFNSAPPRIPERTSSEESLLSLPGLVKVARSSCLQLNSDTLDSSLSLQVVKNLFYIGKCFCMISDAKSMPHAPEKDMDHNDDTDPESEKLENIYSNPLPWLFSKLSYQARSAWIARRNRSVGQDNWSEQPLAIFRCFAAMASYMGTGSLETYLVHILTPVYRILDDDTVKDSLTGDLRTLAQELLELVQNQVGTTKFVEVYNLIRQSVAVIRQERRNEKVVQAVKNPQAFARRKIQHNQVKKNHKIKSTRKFADDKMRSTRTKARRRGE
ncbi:hypothetical protein K439DRAFT_362879 [Ramaria rubella]|nr:hypothetical protein K439DRAFT_362879 [Ramaria rubella]